MATTYPFDPTGTNPANRVALEQHVITAVNFRNSNYVIPRFGPFFETNISISFRDVNGTPRALVKNVDYYFTHHFISASRACASPIYGSITFLDTETAGILQISYNTIGGVWTLNETEIATILADNLYNPRTTAWEQITSLPITFPVIDHEWNLIDMVGASEIVDSLDAIHDAIMTQASAGLPAHIADYNNPHAVSKNHVGLGSVQNFPIATTAQAIAGSINTAYMTPALVKVVLDASLSTNLTAHLGRTDNPHATTKAQVSLGNVDNYATATNAQALAGTSTTLFMTPATTKALTDTVAATVTTHTARVDNPHSTTKTHVGLGLVQNYALATTVAAQTGTDATSYMTPLLTAAAITTQAVTPLNAHIANSANPHATTKAQVALGSVQNYAVATQLEAEAGVSNSTYMTPLRTYQTAIASAAAIMASHTSRVDNPHTTTKAQVGLGNVLNYAIATNAEAIAGTSNAVYMTPVATVATINATVPAPVTVGGQFKGLSGSTSGADAVVSYYIEEIVVKDTAGVGKLGSNLSLSINLNTVGVNGLDSGTLTALTPYTFWVIHNPTTNTWAGIGVAVDTITGNTSANSNVVTNLSTTTRLRAGMPFWHANFPSGSFIKSVDSVSQITVNKPATATTTASTFRRVLDPVMPSGYTMKTRIGFGTTDASKFLRRVTQIGTKSQLVTQHTLATGGTGGGWFGVDMSTLLPPTSSEINTSIHTSATANQGAYVAANNLGSTYGGGSNGGGQFYACTIQTTLMMESMYIYYVSQVAGANLTLNGWTDNF